jgi:hypothetical protein
MGRFVWSCGYLFVTPFVVITIYYSIRLCDILEQIIIEYINTVSVNQEKAIILQILNEKIK